MMNFKSLPLRSAKTFALLAVGMLIAALLFAQSSERSSLNITGYVIDAELDTATHHLAATAVVSFTAPENAEEVSFGFHPALKVTKIYRRRRQAAHRRATGRRHHPRHPRRALRPGAKRRTGPLITTAPSPATKTAPSKA